MNQIKKHPVENLGYNFIPSEFLPEGKDEFYIRFQQNPATDYRQLTRQETAILKSNGNRSDNWSQVLVREGIDILLIEECTFFGLVRIGRLEPYFLEFSQLRTPVGLYRSLIVSCDIGNNVAINNVRLLSHYIIEDEAILINVNEMSCTSHSKFGNGIVKDGEPEDLRIWLEICNENAGRKVIPFDGMLPGDAWLWSKYRASEPLQDAFKAFTDRQFGTYRGTYGTVGKRTVIKNTHIIKDVKIGSDAYIKGANKLKNLTINSNENAKSQIGEGCEMVNGIMGAGSRAFYGVKAVRFILAPFSQLKYGARLINSYLGENATISCCEVLNTLLFPAHEQHHNNSFLCASLVMGQSNIAAGATIGSNHNSRAADGELQAGRGFWPGLCVSLKHNSKFASFTMIAKGDYPAELNIPMPFCLVSNDVHNDRLLVMPGYWFQYNMYAILRNERKFADRDKRREKAQLLEYDFLAPDTVNEMFVALQLLCRFTGQAFYQKHALIGGSREHEQKGKELLESNAPVLKQLEIQARGFENSGRPVHLIKVQEGYLLYKKMIAYYGTRLLIGYLQKNSDKSIRSLALLFAGAGSRSNWLNAGGQLIPEENINTLIRDIENGRLERGWQQVHAFYEQQALLYPDQKLQHGLAALMETGNFRPDMASLPLLRELLLNAIDTKQWMAQSVYASKAKDYENPFRKMVYDSTGEMEAVVGKLKDNPFINEQLKEAEAFESNIQELIGALKE
ncbi:DUF4954 family protein [Niabella drilacis]|uniref:DUF4954 domain-containing protein n=1 Tax=Niabella drilacis (strain DSM 25811 / CCM 8410 / CCUG 62505 / LMG 26954 / E90) TaxID=1285928 RepID=A0A1G6TT63_NIADE|nr:DUF4954 family protein [Niabella drilacis]SDD32104.1 protein of unknown function [Niabella drilacis]